tara:strand:- start:4820 stop:5752 length:933 start_codon:yes stop_codon:yes gene_type:complete
MNEFDYIKKYFRPLTNKVGRLFQDDAAVFSSEKGVDYVLSTDTMVEKIHFLGIEKPELIAKKALRVNLSDLAAMGAEPLYYNLSLSIPKNKADTFIKPFSKGLKLDQEKFNIFLVGGDLTSSNRYITITITIIGKVPYSKAVPRNGALNNDYLYVTGVLGLSNIGLTQFNSKKKEFEIAKNKYLIPEPRVELACELRKYVNCMIDISDGLIQDASHLAKNSGLEININLDQIPTPKFRSLKDKDILESAMYGGDDYELLFSINPNKERFIKRLEKKFKVKISKIGKFKKGKIGRVFSSHNELKTNSYMHF